MILTHLPVSPMSISPPLITHSLSIVHRGAWSIAHAVLLQQKFVMKKIKSPFIDLNWLTLVFFSSTITPSPIQHCFLAQTWAPLPLSLSLTSHSRSTLITLGPCRGLQPLLFLWVTAWRLTELPHRSSKSQSLITHCAPPGVIRSCRSNPVSTAQCQPFPSHPPWLMEMNLCRLKECQRNLFSTWYSCHQCNLCLLHFFFPPYVFFLVMTSSAQV